MHKSHGRCCAGRLRRHCDAARARFAVAGLPSQGCPLARARPETSPSFAARRRTRSRRAVRPTRARRTHEIVSTHPASRDAGCVDTISCVRLARVGRTARLERVRRRAANDGDVSGRARARGQPWLGSPATANLARAASQCRRSRPAQHLPWLLCMDAARALLDPAMSTRNLMLTSRKITKSLDNDFLARWRASTSRHASQGPSPSSASTARDASKERTSLVYRASSTTTYYAATTSRPNHYRTSRKPPIQRVAQEQAPAPAPAPLSGLVAYGSSDSDSDDS